MKHADCLAGGAVNDADAAELPIGYFVVLRSFYKPYG